MLNRKKKRKSVYDWMVYWDDYAYQWCSQDFSTGGGGGAKGNKKKIYKKSFSKWHFCTLNVTYGQAICSGRDQSPILLPPPIFFIPRSTGGHGPLCPFHLATPVMLTKEATAPCRTNFSRLQAWKTSTIPSAFSWSRTLNKAQMVPVQPSPSLEGYGWDKY